MAKLEIVDLFITLTDTSGASKGGGGSGTAPKIKFAWRGNKQAYPDEIAKALGVTVAKDNEPGLIYGMNKPRPARVYINVKLGQGKSRSYIVFADPNKISSLLTRNVLRGKKYRGGTITSVSLPKTSTNPTRKKSDSSSQTPGKKKAGTKKAGTKKAGTKKAGTRRR